MASCIHDGSHILSTDVRFETTNQLLRIDNERMKSELKAVRVASAGDAVESDTEGQSKKRSRGEAGFEGTAGDTAESDMEDGIKKRGRRET
ncbi:uncharacterized protein PAC_17261 [Phialocephala subalpina]|uniref:Uncharacterized protein n=1 Tax=Phialocephala subalpina TaxID=576137 RepID=A0A1L7XQN4_9HELO|nr:uncharacterized protein PAC_17261 [Phialocephala subalpina]